MSVYNREKNRINSNLTLEQFAEYMKQLNRDDIPLENRKMATIDHMMRIIAGSVSDPDTRNDIISSILVRQRERARDGHH